MLNIGTDPARVAREMGIEVDRIYRHALTGVAGMLPSAALPVASAVPGVVAIVDDRRVWGTASARPPGAAAPSP